MKWLICCLTASVIALLVFQSGCAAQCSTANCSGCCDSSGLCQTGNAGTSCGTKGTTCAVCTSTQSCQNNACVSNCVAGTCQQDAGTVCNATTCAQGCCFDPGGGAAKQCITTAHQGQTACGTGGQACAACAAGTQTCQAGACVAGCGSTNCDLGCCSGATCIPFATQTVSQCGYGGAVCQHCIAGDVCTNQGLCVVPPSDAGNQDAGGSYDFPCGNYPPCLFSQICCADTSDGGITLYCHNGTSCPNPEDTISCDGPEECSAGTVCCGVDVGGAGSYPNCAPVSVKATCAPCTTQFASGCPGTNEVVICHTSPDCTDPTYNTCCQFNQNGAALTFCVTALQGALGGGTCF